MAIRDLINKFTSGELDPKMLAEVDYEGYRKGARKLRNVMSLPQGAVQRRFGTVFIDTIVTAVTDPAIDEPEPITYPELVKIIGHEIDGEIYWFVLKSSDNSLPNTDIGLDIYDNDGGLVQTIYPLSTFVSSDIRKIRWVLSYNSIYFLSEDRLPVIVQNLTGVFTAVNAVLSNYPAEDFSYLDSPANNYTNNGTTFQPNLVDATTITASAAVFTSNHAGIGGLGGGVFYGNGGVFRIVSVNAAGTVATGVTITVFTDTSIIAGADSLLQERKWGNGAIIGGAPVGLYRGYPTHGGFFQGRLALGNSLFSPGSVSASVVKSYFDFDDTDVGASGGWSVEAGSSGTDEIADILAFKSLILLTKKGSSATNILVDTPTTPTNVFLNSQGTEGARLIDGQALDNQIFFADVAGNTVWSMTYDVPDSGFTVSNASILSSHLIREPVWTSVYDPYSIDGRYLLVVNEDGTMAIFNSIAAENIKAWTQANTAGQFIDIATVGNEAMTLVKRRVSSGTDVLGYFDAYYTVDSSFNAFVSGKEIINYGTGSVFTQDGDYILIGCEQPFYILEFTLITPASADLNITVEFLTDFGKWQELASFTDSTNGFTSDGEIAWNVIADAIGWASQTIDQTDEYFNELETLYWVRIKRNIDKDDLAVIPVLAGSFVNLTEVINIERLSFDTYMDNSVYIEDRDDELTGVITGLDNLKGQYVFAFANDFPLGRFYVSATGEVDLGDTGAAVNVEIGLDYKVNVTPMPIVGMFQNGYSVYDDMHVDKVVVDYFRTLGLTVQAQVTPEVVPGVYLTDETPYPQTGYSKIPSFNGWDPRVEFVISQSYPAPMTLLAVSYTVEVNP